MDIFLSDYSIEFDAYDSILWNIYFVECPKKFISTITFKSLMTFIIYLSPICRKCRHNITPCTISGKYYNYVHIAFFPSIFYFLIFVFGFYGFNLNSIIFRSIGN